MNDSKWNLNEAYAFLCKDPVIDAVVKITGKLEPLPERDLYRSLLSSIVSQQLSTKAAATIWSRFLAIFNDQPTPDKLIRLEDDQLREAGISYQKAGYLKAVATFASEGHLRPVEINSLSDDELVEFLTRIKGVGRWTSEMILIFSMNRPDVFPVDDLGVRQSVLSLYGLPDEGKITSEGLRALSLQWKPYRSVVSRHLWRLRDMA